MHNHHGKSKRIVNLREVGGYQQLPMEKVVSAIQHYLEGLNFDYSIPHIQIIADINLFLKTIYSEGFVATNLPDDLRKAADRLYERQAKLGAGGIYQDHEIVPSVTKAEFNRIVQTMLNDLSIMNKHAHFFSMQEGGIAHIASEWLKNANAMYRSGKWLSLSTYPEQGLNKIALSVLLITHTTAGHFDEHLLEDVGVLKRMVETYSARLEKQKTKGRQKVTYTPSNIRTQVNLVIHDLKPFQERRKHG